MKYRVYNENSIDVKRGIIFHNYFSTKKEAVAFSEKIGGNAILEKRIANNWVRC